MSGVFRNIDPLTPWRCVPPLLVRGEDTLAGWRGVNILEDARHCSVLYICKYFVVGAIPLLSSPAAYSHRYSICLLNHPREG
jgi:hypothetical protein